MFHCVYRASTALYRTRRIPSARYFHRVTADFSNYDLKGNLITEKVPVIVGNPGETYVLIDPEVGSALRAAASQLQVSAPAASIQERYKLTFFHDSRHFGFESSSYPRLYVPRYIPGRPESSVSPATLFLDGKMHEIVLDGTADGNIYSSFGYGLSVFNIDIAHFAHNASATARNLEHVLDQLKDM
ncbi:hypothetical protein BO94DRAFT_145057 [Aspergillus sclerotioniger CBS 115572]|uniref:Uncharacterized protein n=1 Tax=Aspergillus sclerotioniger CBS 115572 TaxID=1450535 RepID=A0A317W632_9EURO|nr:hypothetical protein BO94DRAFT_145057 [Aspergillus sclerotioniger CBS 115572]PWY81549.1 hypothetical protein BO94DRAFT_145057 [Aspergillus sclerotioniger CBS 115572]